MIILDTEKLYVVVFKDNVCLADITIHKTKKSAFRKAYEFIKEQSEMYDALTRVQRRNWANECIINLDKNCVKRNDCDYWDFDFEDGPNHFIAIQEVRTFNNQKKGK